ncbi:dienelactone hydrolase-like protein [Lepidopterella palustris CBS 459.81]|uniref:Dienelactone hydrolase-like protein n=1 Tax=Lepidopterella palustris CBS 459.81 TaxID=1314670 RepID=A0A8E2JGY2_9PEZI|nr:dienelactone hydrolase-like protein [Lepidopterella palustris CBS 459.81]
MALQFIANSNGWLSFNAETPTLYITAETDDFDDYTLKAWQEEGFKVTYVPFGKGGKTYVNALHHLGDGMSIGERYAIVAFGDAASVCLEVYSEPSTSTSKLCSLIAYYPSSIPDPGQRFSSSFRVLVHLAGGTVGVSRRPEVLGIQGKRRTVQKRITRGIGAGGLQEKITYPAYTYEGVDPGFAEHDLDEYDAVADAVAWSRSLSMVRRGFGAEVELERAWEDNVENKFHAKNPTKLLSTFTSNPQPFVNYTPTMTGGGGHDELLRFYSDFFLSSTPPSFQMRLLSRTVGVDRIVDELHISFKHTTEMPWMLPGIPPTNQKVEVVVVSIVGMRGGKVWHERVYWDQASVLFQVGLLDPEDVGKEWEDKGVQLLPVAGAEAARKIMENESEPVNEMIDDW